MYFRVLTPTGNRRGPVYTESMLRDLHQTDRKRQGVTLRLDSAKGLTQLGIDCSPELCSTVVQRLQDSYPGMTAHRSQPLDRLRYEWSCSLRKDVDVFSLLTTDDFKDEAFRNDFTDPLSGVLSAIQPGRSGRLNLAVELHILPAGRRRLKAAERVRRRLRSGFRWRFAERRYLQWVMSRSSVLRCLGAIWGAVFGRQNQDSQNGTAAGLSTMFECRLVLTVSATTNAAQIASKRLREVAGAFARFQSNQTRLVAGIVTTNTRRRERTFLMSASEIAALWHPPTETTDNVVRVSRGNFRELEPPAGLVDVDPQQGTVLGKVQFRNDRTLVRISDDDLRRHLFVIGKTGTGKSTFLSNVVRQQMESGKGCVLIDPHGQLANDVLAYVPKRRKNDVVRFDASDSSNLPSFNPMIGPTNTDPTLIADAVLTSFKNVFGMDSDTAPRLLHIFRNCLLSLIGTPQASLSSVQRILVDELLRKSVIARVTNPAVREFWLTEFGRWNARDRTQYIASLQNKLGAFTSNDRLNRILNPSKKGIVLREIMDSSKILICNLSKGQVGHDASKLLGSLLLSSLQVAAMSRADIPENERTDSTVVIDEFHSYLAEGNSTMADALAESRKYRTSYVLSTQMLDGQLDSATLAGVLGNCGSAMCMTVGPKDAETMAELLGHGLDPSDLMQIPQYQGYLRLLNRGVPGTLSFRTLPPRR